MRRLVGTRVSRGAEVERRCDGVLDAVVVALATWTVVYHLCLVLRLPVAWALVAEVVLLVATTLLWRSQLLGVGDALPEASTVQDRPAPAPTREGASPAPASLARGTVGLAAVAALAMATSAPWLVVWPTFLLAALVVSWQVVRGLRHVDALATRDPDPTDEAPEGGRTAILVLVWAVALTALSTVVLRPNPDDLFYVNLSQWVAAEGTFPIRDTIFSDLAFPMANWPPTASYDALVGALAYLGAARAATVAYVVVTPVATFVSVLALWRLLRAWRVRQVGVALSAALVFLLFDGTSSYGSPGNLFLTRLWQGKVILLCVIVPVLLVYALAHVEQPTRRTAFRLFLGGAAAVALSTTASFLVPIIAVAGAAPLLLRRRWGAAAAGCVAMAAYPMAAAVATLALDGRSADDFGSRRLFRFDPSFFGHEIFLTGLVAAVGIVATLVGALLVPHRAARVTTALLVLATGVTFVPGVTRLSYDLVGLGPTLWRVSWGCTIAALVGVLVVRVVERLRELSGPRRRRWAAPVAAVLAAGLTAGFGAPIWTESTSSVLVTPFQWKRGEGTRSVTEWLLETGAPGDVVLAPDALAITVAVTTTEVKTVAPRDYYMDYLRDVPSFHFRERLELVTFANRAGPTKARDVRRALRVLEVDSACLYVDDVDGLAELRTAGFTEGLTSSTYRCLLR